MNTRPEVLAVIDGVMEQREEVLRAFVAKYGFQPDEFVQVSQDGRWWVERRLATTGQVAEDVAKDAARYQWLRAADWDRRALPVPYVLAGKNFPESDEHLAGDNLDEAIDTAMLAAS